MKLDQPVPPYTAESVELAETTPATACRLPVTEPSVRAFVVRPELNVCRAVYVFVVYVFGIVVDPLIYEFTLVSPYELLTRQVPFTEKQPAVRFRPFANVELAVVDDVLRIPAVIPPTNVDVAVVVEIREPTVILVPVAETVFPSAENQANCPYVPALTVPVDPGIPTQVPFIAKQPAVRFIPLAKVELAVVEVTLIKLVLTPPTNVDVAVVVASNTAAVVVPTTESLEYGEVVPIPTLPVRYAV